MAEEFCSAAAWIYGWNWQCSPRSSMFPMISAFSQCSLDVPSFHWPAAESLKSGRISADDYSGSNGSGLSGCVTGFMATNVGNGWPSPSVFKEVRRTLFDDSENSEDVNRYASILDEFSGEDSTTLLQNYSFRDDSELHIGGGMLCPNFNIPSKVATPPDDHSSNLSRLSPPYVPKPRSNSKPYATNKLQPCNKPSSAKQPVTNMWDSAVNSSARQPRNEPEQLVFAAKKESSVLGANNNTRSVKSTAKMSTNKMADSSSSVPKRRRILTPSPLPTFKVRKEKLGDRITALQQLVSPFGKTDTASVLHETISYIESLHDQVQSLSTTPHMKDGALRRALPRRMELRSRGLCLVPISSAFPISGDAPVDFWTPNLGGPLR